MTNPTDEPATIEQVIERAERAIYLASGKQSGLVTGFHASDLRTLLSALSRNTEPMVTDARDWSFVWKWVERGLFDGQISEREALQTMAHYPGAPWKMGRWDVDHKPYASQFYAMFPLSAGKKGTDDGG